MPKTEKELIAIHEESIIFNGLKINYAVLENNTVLIDYKSIIKPLNTTTNEVKDIVHPTLFWNSKKKWNNGLYLKGVPEILISLISGDHGETLKNKANGLLQ
jgi:hypothetical protein